MSNNESKKRLEKVARDLQRKNERDHAYKLHDTIDVDGIVERFTKPKPSKWRTVLRKISNFLTSLWGEIKAFFSSSNNAEPAVVERQDNKPRCCVKTQRDAEENQTESPREKATQEDVLSKSSGGGFSFLRDVLGKRGEQIKKVVQRTEQLSKQAGAFNDGCSKLAERYKNKCS